MIQMTIGTFWFEIFGLFVFGFVIGIPVGWCIRATRFQGWGS